MLVIPNSHIQIYSSKVLLTSQSELGLNRFAPNRFQCERTKPVSNRFKIVLACPCEHPFNPDHIQFGVCPLTPILHKHG